MIRLIQGDCIEEMRKLAEEDVKVDLVLTDLPYGTLKGIKLKGGDDTTTEWDDTIPTKPMFELCEKLLRQNGCCIFFSQEPYTSFLRQYKPFNLEFSYPLYWLKDHFANNLSCNKAPVNYVENLSVWYKKYDTENVHPLRVYAQQLLKEMGISYKEIERRLGHRRAEHFFYRVGSSQFSLCTENTYNELINVFHINDCKCFLPYYQLKQIDSAFKRTFNKEKKHKSNVFQYKRPYNGYHPTEKPVDLLKDLILTYTNPQDTVLDFTMGSGSTGVACLETNRNFIGIELDEDYYNIAKQRCSNFQSTF